MAKKQTRRSISVSRSTYERLKAFCEANNVSMSQLVETRVNDFLGTEGTSEPVRPAAPRPLVPGPIQTSSPGAGPGVGSSFGMPMRPSMPAPVRPAAAPAPAVASVPSVPVPMTSAAARSVVEPPPPIIKPKNDAPAPAPVVKTADQIFTF